MVLDGHLPPDAFPQLDLDHLVPSILAIGSQSWPSDDLVQSDALCNADCCTRECGVEVAHAEVVCNFCRYYNCLYRVDWKRISVAAWVPHD